MRKLFVLMICVLMVLWLNPVAFGRLVNDTGACADGYPKDMAAARADLFIEHDYPDQEPWLLLELEMCSSSTIPGFIPGMPGVVVWELDVDHDETTGGLMSMLGIPVPPCPCKTTAGFDIVITQVFRDQGDASSTALCKGCSGTGGAVCAKADGVGDCYPGCNKIYEYCPVGGPDCYEITTPCPGSTDCYSFTTPCPSQNCSIGRKQGEWYAFLSSAGTVGEQFISGRGVPLPPLPTDTNPLNIAFENRISYRDLIQRALDEGMPASYTLEQMMNLPPQWQVSVYYDPAFTDLDDYITNDPSLTLDIADWLPHIDDPSGPKASGEFYKNVPEYPTALLWG